MLTRATLRYDVALKNNYLRSVGRYDFQFVTAPLKQIQNHLTLINTLDGYVWAFLLASIVAVFFTLIIIDTNYANWFGTSTKDIIHQSKYMYF